MKIKIITGYREDQFHTIDSEEAHKAYYLFQHPEQRGVFNNGVAIRGVDIQSIIPDYQSTMGWNPTHELDSDDWNEIRNKNVDREMRDLLYKAKEIANSKNPQINKPLSETLLEHKNNLLH